MRIVCSSERSSARCEVDVTTILVLVNRLLVLVWQCANGWIVWIVNIGRMVGLVGLVVCGHRRVVYWWVVHWGLRVAVVRF